MVTSFLFLLIVYSAGWGGGPVQIGPFESKAQCQATRAKLLVHVHTSLPKMNGGDKAWASPCFPIKGA